MNRLLPLLLLAAVAAPTPAPAQTTLPPTNFAVLNHEHTDGLCILYNPASSNLLSLIAWQRDASLDLPTNQVILVGNTQAMLTLPAGTPFGDAGQPFWILPQSQNPNLLYLGVNAERVPGGVFSGPLTIYLKRLMPAAVRLIRRLRDEPKISAHGIMRPDACPALRRRRQMQSSRGSSSGC